MDELLELRAPKAGALPPVSEPKAMLLSKRSVGSPSVPRFLGPKPTLVQAVTRKIDLQNINN
jgi:hypothetical protein